MDLSNIPDVDDSMIGEAILTIMFIFMFVWLTSAASPIQFPNRATWGNLVTHFYFILYLVVPIALLGIIEAFYGAPKTGAAGRIDTYTQILKSKRNQRKAYRLANAKRKVLKEQPKNENIN